VDVLKVTRYDWQKSHFSPVEGVQSVGPEQGGRGGQKFVPAIENDARPLGCIHHFIFRRDFLTEFSYCVFTAQQHHFCEQPEMVFPL